MPRIGTSNVIYAPNNPKSATVCQILKTRESEPLEVKFAVLHPYAIL